MNPTVIKIIILAGFLAGVFAYGQHVSTAEWQAKWAKRDATDLATTAQHERDQRALEQFYQSKINEVQGNARQAIDAAARDAADATARADSLHELARKAAARCAAGTVASTASGGKAAAGPGMVLADVLSRADARAGELAAYADRAAIAGRACEQAYDSVAGGAR